MEKSLSFSFTFVQCTLVRNFIMILFIDSIKLIIIFPICSRKDATYELDYCYEQDEDIEVIFSREIKPLISDIYAGKSASIVAYGARGSGKTYTIQVFFYSLLKLLFYYILYDFWLHTYSGVLSPLKGTEKNPGLVVMALTELLLEAERIGKSVCLSLCEVSHEHVYDLLDTNHSEVQVLEDARGKINLKGLSQVETRKEFRSNESHN